MPLVATRGGASAFGLGWSAASAGEELGGMVLLTPTSIAYSGTFASIGTNGSVEFTAVSSLSLNGVFDATYDNYMVVLRCSTTLSNGPIRTRLRNGGTDKTGADYNRQRLLADGTTVSANRQTTDFMELGYVDTAQTNGHVAHIYGPYLTQPTAFRSVTSYSLSNAAIREYANTHSLSESSDGFTFYTATDNFTGLVSVYGLVGA